MPDLSRLFIIIGAKTEEFESAMANVQDKLKRIGVAFTAVGAAGLKMVDSAREMNAQLGSTGITIGKTTAEMRDLALETTNVTFPLKNVIPTFELLAKAGIKNTEVMKQAAIAFDTLGDATGNEAQVLADLLLPAFKLFGEEIPTTAAELDKFTWLTKNTLVDLTDFGTLLTRMAPYMDTLNLSMEDAIVTLAALGEKGITGTAATLKLRTAITQAASSGQNLQDVLGITNEEMDKYRTQMESAIGVTQEYADQMNTQYGIMDRVKQKWSELTLSAGSFLTPLEPILAGMTALGPVMIALSMGAIPKLIGALKGLTGALAGLAAGLAMVGLGVYKLNECQEAHNKLSEKFNKLEEERQKKLAGTMNQYYKVAQEYLNMREELKAYFGEVTGAEKVFLDGLREHIRLTDEQRKAMEAINLRWDLVPESIERATKALEEHNKVLRGQGLTLEENIGIMERYMAHIRAVPVSAPMGEVGAWAAQYLAAHPGVKWGGLEEIGRIIESYGNIPFEMPSYQHGGIVPGPIGSPVPIIAHGGEPFLGVGAMRGIGGMGDINVYIAGSVVTERELQESIREAFLDVKNRNTSTGF